jgi:GT2 family glycosyltransferase
MLLSPVVIFAYNRPIHLKKTIEALQENIYSSDTEVYIISDASKHSEDVSKVEEVRSYIREISGFKQINIVERDRNHGLANNIISGVSEIINKYGKIIAVEDDLIVSHNFLCYMNSALEFY